MKFNWELIFSFIAVMILLSFVTWFTYNKLSKQVILECHETGDVYYRHEGTLLGTQLVETTKEHADVIKQECVEGILINGENFTR